MSRRTSAGGRHACGWVYDRSMTSPSMDGLPASVPLNRDLSTILRRLVTRRRTREAQHRLANDRLTLEYLEAGLRLIAQQMTAQPTADSSPEADDRRPFFDWLSKTMVIDEVARAGVLHGSDGSFRDRWEFRGDYIEDLLAYSLWSRHSAVTARVAAESLDLGTKAADFVRAIHLASYRSQCAALESSGFNVSIIGAATAACNDTARESTAETYRVVTESWHALYDATLKARGLRLRPGITLHEITWLLTAVAEGLLLRQIGDPGIELFDHDRQESLLGKAVIAIIAACVDSGDGLSVEDLVRNLSGHLEQEP